MSLHPLRSLREINASLCELERADLRAREFERVELARSASAYSQRAREVVDGTMSLSAVLMRAGEVTQAERLLAEVEVDVRQEKQVLLETVQEYKLAKRDRRDRMTRLRLAKMVSTAFLATSVFAFSAFGVAVAKYFTDVAPAAPAPTAVAQADGPYEVSPSLRRIILPLGDLKLELSPEQYKEFRRLISKDDHTKLRSFLLGILPTRLADKLDSALAQAGIGLPVHLAELQDTATQLASQIKKAATSPSSGSSTSSSSSSTPQESSSTKPEDGKKDGDPGAKDDDSGSGSGRCDDEDRGEGGHNLHVGPLRQCIPLIEGESGD